MVASVPLFNLYCFRLSQRLPATEDLLEFVIELDLEAIVLGYSNQCIINEHYIKPFLPNTKLNIITTTISGRKCGVTETM